MSLIWIVIHRDLICLDRNLKKPVRAVSRKGKGRRRRKRRRRRRRKRRIRSTRRVRRRRKMRRRSKRRIRVRNSQSVIRYGDHHFINILDNI